MTNKSDIENIITEIISEVDNNYQFFKDPSIESGYMGLAMFYFYCHRYFKDEKFKDKGELMIENSIRTLSDISTNKNFKPKYRGDSLSNIISSFGKGLLFIENQLGYNYDFSEFHSQLNEILLELTERNLIDKDFDFFSGSLSAGHYFLNKYSYQKSDFSKAILLKILDGIRKEAIIPKKDQLCWAAPTLANTVYTGISHGSAMIINYITKLFEFSIVSQNDVNQKKLLENAVDFVMAKKREIVDGYFPNKCLSESKNIEATQFAICYGDLGILYALYNANKILMKPKLGFQIDSMLKTSMCRTKNSRYTYDGGIFYGASGIFCVFKDLYERSEDDRFRNSYQYWYDQIISYRDPYKKSHAGFISSIDYVKKGDNSSFYSFGWGISGIGICLMIGLDKDLPLLNETLLIGI